MKKFVLAAMAAMSLTVAACSDHTGSTVTNNTTVQQDNGATVTSSTTTVDNTQ